MDKRTKIGTAVVGGYLLGRFKKARLAILVGSALMGKRLDLNVRRLARDGLRQLARSPQVAELSGQIRRDLFDAGRAAGMAAVTRKAEQLTESLEHRTAELQEAAAGPADGEPSAESDESGQDAGRQPRQERESDEGEPPQRTRQHAASGSGSASKHSRRRAAEPSSKDSGPSTRGPRGSATSSARRQRVKSSDQEGK